MITALSRGPSTSLMQVYQNNPSTLTNAKIKKISMAIFGSLILIAGYCLYSVGTPIAIMFAIPLFIAGGTILWQITKIKDYEDLQSLRAYREKAKSMTLSEIEDIHTRCNMLKYEIPAKGEFPRIFRDAMKGRDIHAIISYYEAYSANSTFNVPLPLEFKGAFERATKGMTACEIFDSYSVEKLFEYGIVSKQFRDARVDFNDFRKRNTATTEKAKKILQQQVTKALKEFQPVLDQANGDNPTQQAWIMQLQREAQHLANSPAFRWFNGSLKIMQEPTIPEDNVVADSLSGLFEAHKAFIRLVTAAKKQFDGQQVILDQDMEHKQQGINKRFAS